ncbi:tetratricopeptide repeat protein [Maridesulfovibrio sp.]|uniref:tetratricopeptide repeat protein n=1 Tax=Maridesulfovibrio sp. TaxID=2795000 RepID=UPI0029CA472E|nr:tetratricopeptide repeat protein [Maridesulfovibrio sp.]
MRFSLLARLLFLAVIFFMQPAAAKASPPLLAIGSFLTPSGIPSTEFRNFVEQKLIESGFSCANCTEDHRKSRYSLSGLMVKNDKGTSFSALLTDNFHLEPDVFIKGKQMGGISSEPAAAKLADSAAKLIANQSVASIEVNGDSRLTPNAVMALAQIVPGEKATPQKIIAGRIILENCGLFEKSRIYLTPDPEGRKVKISVTERESIVPGTMPGPGKVMLDNILGPPNADLPEFPAVPDAKFTELHNGTSAGYLAYRAEDIIARFSHEEQDFGVEDVKELVAVANAIRNKITRNDSPCRDMCIIMLKMCSMLDSKTIHTITEELRSGMELNTAGSDSLENNLQRIEFLTQAYSSAREAQLILTSRIFHDRIHSPVVPWILFSLGQQDLKAEDITRAAPLLNGAISVSSLPVSPEMLLTAAKAQYSNLDCEAGSAATAQLKPLLADPDLDNELRRQIQSLSRLDGLCDTATSITDKDSFERQLQKGDALILLDRPDLAEPIFHKLHGIEPDDARPFTGFARLAFQRTDNLLSVRPYLERAEHLRNKDRYFYELALAYKIERITEEALPTIKINGRNSEEASATRFLLPKTLEYAAGYEKYNPAQANLIKAGVNVLGEWLAYPVMTAEEAFQSMFELSQGLEKEMGELQEILSAELYFSSFAADKEEADRLISRPLSVKSELETRFLQLNLLIREMALNPCPEIFNALKQAGKSSFSDATNREKAVILKADALAIAGLYSNSTETLERAGSLYTLALDLNSANKGRVLNNLACVNLALGRIGEADDLYDEAVDISPEKPEVVELGKILSSLSGDERQTALDEFAKRTHWTISGKKSAGETAESYVSNATSEEIPQRMDTVLLDEKRSISSGYDNYIGLWINFNYNSNIWLLPSLPNLNIQPR